MLLQKFLLRGLRNFPLPLAPLNANLFLFSTTRAKSQFFEPTAKEYLGKIPLHESLEEFDVIPPQKYRELIGQPLQFSKERRSCYVAVEKNGEVFHLFDASKIPYGKMCQRIAHYLQGKHKPTFKQNEASFADTIVVVNASKLKLTGKKKLYKTVKYHTGFVGHLREIPIRNFIEEKPEQLIHLCVSKMLPKNKLRRQWLEKLHVFREPNHTFLHVLPNFVPQVLAGQDYAIDFKNEFKKDTAKIVYHSNNEIPEEFKHLPLEEDPEIYKASKERKLVAKMTPANREKIEALKKREKIIKRYREVVYKPPKNRDPNLDDRPVLIQSVKQAKKYNLMEHMVRDSGSEDDDEIMK